ncbi:crustacyanin-C1 subunit-like isoform X2 [Macrobrachium nipponense]|uniref:crustacyanin-C1 subunit-like isoform X2 n=1 Tax=Macrobrachium nipponense TaxID=159736 RepID=UPI0030C7D4FB
MLQAYLQHSQYYNPNTMNFGSFLLVVVLAAGLGNADKVPDFVIKGKCPVVDEQSLWNKQLPRLSEFGGVWFQQAITTNPYQLLDKCVRLQYDFDGKGFDATATGLTAEGGLLKRRGKIVPMPLGDPHLMVNFDNSFPAPLLILDTDYENYACLYSCMNYNHDYHSDFSFIFTRSETPSNSHLKKCEKVFRSIGVNTRRFFKTVQGNVCSYDKQVTL